jgi:hypothetical protein
MGFTHGWFGKGTWSARWIGQCAKAWLFFLSADIVVKTLVVPASSGWVGGKENASVFQSIAAVESVLETTYTWRMVDKWMITGKVFIWRTEPSYRFDQGYRTRTKRI